MNRKNFWMIAAIIFTCGMSVLTSSCTSSKTLKNVSGVLDEPIVNKIPKQVEEGYVKTIKVHPFDIMNDTANNVNVCGIGELDGGLSTEGNGVMVTKNAISTTFTDIRNTRQPRAFYDASTNDLWLTSCVMEGTGTHVEQLDKIHFGSNDIAQIAGTIEPYGMQQKILEHLKYAIDGEQVTFFADDTEIASSTNTVKDMGGFDDENPIWIGEQISYNVDNGNIRVCFVPGVKFKTGLVLTYDDMPTLSASVKMAEDGGYTLSDFKKEEPEGAEE